MLDLTQLLAKRRLTPEKLLTYGFQPHAGGYVYHSLLTDAQFMLTITVSAAGQLSAQVRDPADNEPYTLHLAAGANGSFIGSIREAYEAALLDVVEKCGDRDVFKTANAQAVMAYIRKKYGDEPEYLWDKFPDNAIFRLPANQKWYAALLQVDSAKLGLPSKGVTDILDLKAPPEEIAQLVDGVSFFPGYHMNKKHWYTIPLAGTVALPELCRRIDVSYQLTAKQGKK